MNYFELFELPVSLQVEKMGLSKKYFELQKKFHPDFYTQDEADAQKDALEQSSMINKALKTLQKPQETIKYVLQLKGLIEDEEKYQLQPDFLMEMMELNEKLLEEDAEEFRMEVDVLENTLYKEVQNIIENYNDSTVTNHELLKVKEYYFKKKYLQRILDRLDD